MNNREKKVIAAVAVLLVGLGAAAVLMDSQEELPPAKVVRPAPEAKKKSFSEGTAMRLAKVPSEDEIPQEFKEAENYLLDRWGHLEDAGLSAPGIMPEGDMYFQERRIMRGVRGNGKPVYAKFFLRPERFHGPVMKSGNGLEAMAEHNPFMSIPGRTEADAVANVKRFAERTGAVSKNVSAKRLRPLSEEPGSSYTPRKENTGAAVQGN